MYEPSGICVYDLVSQQTVTVREYTWGVVGWNGVSSLHHSLFLILLGRIRTVLGSKPSLIPPLSVKCGEVRRSSQSNPQSRCCCGHHKMGGGNGREDHGRVPKAAGLDCAYSVIDWFLKYDVMCTYLYTHTPPHHHLQ